MTVLLSIVALAGLAAGRGPEPTRVTLDLRDVTSEAALEALAGQAGAGLGRQARRVAAVAGGGITLVAEDAPVTDVMAELRGQGLTVWFTTPTAGLDGVGEDRELPTLILEASHTFAEPRVSRRRSGLWTAVTGESYAIERRLDLRDGSVEREVTLDLELSTWLDPAWHHAGTGVAPRVEVVLLEVRDAHGRTLERDGGWDMPPHDEQGHRHGSTYAVPSPGGGDGTLGLGRLDGWVLVARPAEVATGTIRDAEGQGATAEVGPYAVDLRRESDTRAVLTLEADEALASVMEAVDWPTAVRYRLATEDGSPGAYAHVWTSVRGSEVGKVSLTVDLPKHGRGEADGGRGTFELRVPVRYRPYLVPLSLIVGEADGEGGGKEDGAG